MLSRSIIAVAAVATASFTVASPAAADHVSRCRLVAVEGYTGGPSVIRMISPDGRPCAIPHYTVNCTKRHVKTRVHQTVQFRSFAGFHHGHMHTHGNRVIYRGTTGDRFAYQLTDRAGQRHQIHVDVARR